VKKENTVKKMTLLLVLAAPIAGLGACNTTRGFGEDVEATGEAVQDAAQDAEDELTDDDK
jgi:entericidin B